MAQTISQGFNPCLAAAFRHIKNGLLILDRNGEVIYFNQAAESITGYGREEVLGAVYAGLPFAGPLVAEHGLQGFLDRQESLDPLERTLCCKDGSQVPVESVFQTVLDENGELVGAVEVLTDLSAINRLKDEVARTRTLSALGEMAASVAHEIRNPLGGIGGYAALLERDLDDQDPRRNLVKKIIEGVASLDKIVTNLLIYTRPIRPDLRWIDLTLFVDEVLAFLEVELEQKQPPVQIKRDFPPEPVGARIDPSLMQQILLNIFRNAVEAMKKRGGCLTIRLLKVDPQNPRAGQNNRKNFVNLLVADEGVGMSKEIQDKIFNPFFTTREDGTGLGMAIAKKLIQEQDGSISVSSQPGVGTEISILLPYHP